MMSHKDSGYSLLELIIVMAIIALMTSAGMSVLQKHNTDRSPAYFADRIVMMLNAARLKAITEKREVVVTLSLGETRMFRLDNVDQVIIDKAITGLSATSGRTQNTLSTDATFIFFPEGRATGGSIEFKDGTMIRRIDVNWLTGLVSQSQSSNLK